jgi:hypothetical protein
MRQAGEDARRTDNSQSKGIMTVGDSGRHYSFTACRANQKEHYIYK